MTFSTLSLLPWTASSAGRCQVRCSGCGAGSASSDSSWRPRNEWKGVTAICVHEEHAWSAGAYADPDTLVQWTMSGSVATRVEVASAGAARTPFDQ